MRVPGSARQPHRRQNAASQPIPVDIPGVSGGTTATNVINSAENSLIVNTNTANIPSASVPGIVSGSAIVITTTSSVATSSSIATPSSSAASSPASDISIGTVIATCLGAFVGLLILIFVAVWWYKRSGQNIKKSDGRSPPSTTRNARGKPERPDPWNRLEEKEIDVWEGMIPSPSIKGVIFPATAESPPQVAGSAEKLSTMFKKTPSLHSTDKGSSESHSVPYFAQTLAQSAEFAKYHPHLAEELAKTVTPMRPNITRQTSIGPISWDGETIHDDDTFVSLRSKRFDSHLTNANEALSPAMVRVVNTPIATSSEPHYWESAEVMHYNEDNQEIQNPFSDVPLETRKNTDNPFFNAQGQVDVLKQRSSNPFTDSARVSRVTIHTTEEPLDSIYDADRALQSLIAALDVSPEEVEQRLRIASMQSTHASIISTGSDYASVVEFPLPPTHALRGAQN